MCRGYFHDLVYCIYWLLWSTEAVLHWQTGSTLFPLIGFSERSGRLFQQEINLRSYPQARKESRKALLHVGLSNNAHSFNSQLNCNHKSSSPCDWSSFPLIISTNILGTIERSIRASWSCMCVDSICPYPQPSPTLSRPSCSGLPRLRCRMRSLERGEKQPFSRFRPSSYRPQFCHWQRRFTAACNTCSVNNIRLKLKRNWLGSYLWRSTVLPAPCLAGDAEY